MNICRTEPTCPNQLTRRNAITAAVQSVALATIAATSQQSIAAELVNAKAHPESDDGYMPENDYPFFGGGMPDAYRS